jgi:mono/diheme cytochrome c family protein
MGVAVLAINLLAFPCFARTQPVRDSGLQILSGVNSVEGETVFREKGCFDCHSYDSTGGSIGPDLGTGRMRGTSPSALAAAMWNHFPTMLRSTGNAPALNVRESAALYSFFYFRLYFNQAYPNMQHGERYFEARCSSCHALTPTEQSPKPGPPVSRWGSVTDPMALAGLMWNHSTTMLGRMNRESKSWPRMTGQDVTDLLAYLWRRPELLPEQSRVRFGNDEAGEALFISHCTECHTIGRAVEGRIDLTVKLQHTTLPEVAASMWNHAPAMKHAKAGGEIGSFTETQIRDLLTYLVIRPLFNEAGDAGKGLQVFQTKKCIACHGPGRLNPGTPAVSSFKGPFDGVRLTAALWSHGPAMLSEMKSAGIPWPRFKESEMLDLLAYLNQNARR